MSGFPAGVALAFAAAYQNRSAAPTASPLVCPPPATSTDVAASIDTTSDRFTTISVPSERRTTMASGRVATSSPTTMPVRVTTLVSVARWHPASSSRRETVIAVRRNMRIDKEAGAAVYGASAA